MYPVARMFWQLYKARKTPKLGLTETYVSQHHCLPWDLDVWMELNNGRTLTLYDLGRIPLSWVSGLHAALKRKGWGMTVAGSTTRYRRRITVFQLITMKSRLVTWDDRFIYIEQSMWTGKVDCAGHVLLRLATVGPKGIVAPKAVIDEMGHDGSTPPPMSEWIKSWVQAEALRPWPPMQGA